MSLPSPGQAESDFSAGVPAPRQAVDGTGPGLAHGGEEWNHRMRIEDSAGRNQRAAELFAAGRFREAVDEFARALADCRSALGPDHPCTLTVAGNLGVAQVAAGQKRKGLRIVLDNLADRVRVLGDEHPDTLTARDALAAVHRSNGNADDAVRVSEQVVQQRTRTLGATHQDTLTSRMGLALAHAAAGDLSTAQRLLVGALIDAEETYGARHPYTAMLLDRAHAWGLVGTDA